MYNHWQKRLCLTGITAIACLVFSNPSLADDIPPVIYKKGTIALDIVETSPVVFKGRLYRFEYIRGWNKSNTTGNCYFRFVDVKSGVLSNPFATGYKLGSAFARNNRIYVTCVAEWGGDTITLFESEDMEHWRSREVIKLAGWKIYNTSTCHDGEQYVMAFEVGAPPQIAGQRFTTCFLTSPDLETWELMPGDHVYTRDRYSACPDLHFHDGYYYMIYLEQYPVPTDVHESWHEYAPHIVRSKDLISFEQSPYNPVMRASDEDKIIANICMPDQQREKVRKAVNLNNSDIGMCEFEKQVIIFYSWGDQHGNEFLGEAFHDGPLDDFLERYFPGGGQ